MKILYGTTNQAKIEVMKPVAKALGFTIFGLRDLGKPLPVVEETGNEPLDNACIKARAYYDAFRIPVFSCDSGLYFDGVEDGVQPKTHVRRVNGKELTDEQMTSYYAELAERHGGRLTARYRNAVCFIYDERNCFYSMDESLTSEPFYITNVPHKKRVAGFPLDPLSVDIGSGKYYYDLGDRYDRVTVVDGLYRFFENALSRLVM